jgi:myo-inositol-hexaphosphate 3-phosphohydrolase
MRPRRRSVPAIALLVGALPLALAIGPATARLPSTAEHVAKAPVLTAAALIETTPVATAGDSADDPAIWVNPSDPQRSLVIANNKKGALESYDLAGDRVQRINKGTGSSFFGNVDVRGNYVAVSNNGIRVYSVNPSTRMLTLATEGSGRIPTSGEGLCLYDPGAAGLAGGLHAFVVARKNGRIRQYSLTDSDGDGLLAGDLVRDFTLGSEAEGCVTDDAAGSLFVSEENKAVWRYGAAATAGTTTRVKVAAVGAQLPPDAEGLALAGDYLFVSAQNVAHPNQNFVVLYERTAPYAYVRSVRIVAGANADDCDRTDGIAASSASLGPTFSQGLFVCQDGNNNAPGSTGHQNFKYVRLQDVTG